MNADEPSCRPPWTIGPRIMAHRGPPWPITAILCKYVNHYSTSFVQSRSPFARVDLNRWMQSFTSPPLCVSTIQLDRCNILPPVVLPLLKHLEHPEHLEQIEHSAPLLPCSTL